MVNWLPVATVMVSAGSASNPMKKGRRRLENIVSQEHFSTFYRIITIFNNYQ